MPKSAVEPDAGGVKLAKAEFQLPATPAAQSQGTPLPITLPTALSLTGANALDIQIADERVRTATAQLDRAKVLWLPNLNFGVDYFRHDGQIQDIVGNVFTTSKSSFLLGAGPQAVVSTSDAVFAPLAARQVTWATQFDAQTSRNDTTLSVAVAYFNVQQARGEVGGAVESLRRAEDLVARTVKLAPDLAPELEINRARTGAARCRQAVETAYERWQVASADLTRLLRLQPGTLVEPAEEPSLSVNLIDPSAPLDELIAIGLTNRPELASYQAVVQAALVRVKQEKRRMLYPTLAVRGVGSNTPGLAGGYFGGGVNDFMGNFGSRFSVDLQAVWEVQNLGFGNRAQVREREADSRRALLELLRTQDIVTAEVVQAHAQALRASRRLKAAEDGVSNAVATAEKNLQGLGQTKRAGEQLILVFRPQEAVAAVAALDQAYRDYYQAVGDHNRAQFRLYRALGHPAQALCPVDRPVEMLPATGVPALPMSAPAPVSVMPSRPGPRVGTPPVRPNLKPN
ncbi:MAG: TolC family protein [Bacteroidales bacterium]|nr:TolC family protein [Bacteroidales bacterium]